MNNRPDDFDHVAAYAQSLGWRIQSRTVLVEGTSDVAFLELAAKLEMKETGSNLIGGDLAIVAAGAGDLGGTRGVCRELIRLTGYARASLDRRGRPKYRFAALMDNDAAGRGAAKMLKNFDSSIIPFKDVFLLHPNMPISGNLDPKTLRATFARLNDSFSGLDWEIEDTLSDDITNTFESSYPHHIVGRATSNGKTHRDYSVDGKRKLQNFAFEFSNYEDVKGLTDVIRSLRFMMGLPAC